MSFLLNLNVSVNEDIVKANVVSIGTIICKIEETFHNAHVPAHGGVGGGVCSRHEPFRKLVGAQRQMKLAGNPQHARSVRCTWQERVCIGRGANDLIQHICRKRHSQGGAGAGHICRLGKRMGRLTVAQLIVCNL